MPELSIAGEDAFYYHKADNMTSSQCTRHYHNSFEIYYLKEGGCNYFIDNRSYDLQAGDIVLIPEGVIHKTNYDKNEPHTRYLINCSSAYVPRGVLPMTPQLMYLYRNKDICASIEELLIRVGEEYERHDAFRDEALRCLTFELFFLLARNANECSETSSGSLFIEETVKYIQKNYMTDITLSMMSKLYSVSSEHLSRTFKKETGFGFSEYFTLVRLQKAEYMLRNEPGRSICEIAYACGFNDSNYFSDKFRRSYGISPSSIRRRSRK